MEEPDERYATPRLRQAATRLLAHETGTDPATSENLASAASRLLDTLWQRVAEIIGMGGVEAIFRRTMKLRRGELAFLGEGLPLGNTGTSLAAPLRARLQEQEPEVIRGAAVTLFATFVGLLATVIGDRLAWSVLQQIWPTLRQETGLQETQE